MVTVTDTNTRREPLLNPARIARDYALVAPGFFLSLFAFVVLVPLFALSVSTMIIWIGVLLLPTTLWIGSAFAQLSRARVRLWGADLPPAQYAPRRPGMSGLFRAMADPRRWLDLAFETIVAFPLRTFTFCVSMAWTLGGIGGITYILWGVFLPQDDVPLPGLVIEAITSGAAPDALTHSYLLDATFNFVGGCLLLVTLIPVMRGLAVLDATLTVAALGGGLTPVPEPEPAAAPQAARSLRPAIMPAARAETLSFDGWLWIIAVLTAAVSVAVSWPVLAALYGVPVVIAMLIAFAQASAVLLARRWPLIGIAVQTLVATVEPLIAVAPSGEPWPWPWPAMALILQAILVLLVSLRSGWPMAVAAWILPLAGSVVAMAIHGAGLDAGAWANLSVCGSISLGTLGIGIIIRQLIVSRSALRDEQRTSAELGAERRRLDERNRIARELHDVVAHSMSVISVQATTAKYRIPGVGAEAEGEFGSIAESSRQALAEMRSLLTLLRSSNDDDLALAPQATLGDIPELVAATRQSGARITLRMPADDAPPAVPSATGLTAYRIVQEALSNAVRHAPGAAIDVAVDVAEHEVRIAVVNGRPETAALHLAAPGAGLGLAGVHERTAALGGTVDAAPTPDGGFGLAAVLPLG